MEHKSIAESLELSDRIYITAKREAFVTLKDRKPSFKNNPSCTLINPSKPKLGRISKKIGKKIVLDIKINQRQTSNSGKIQQM